MRTYLLILCILCLIPVSHPVVATQSASNVMRSTKSMQSTTNQTFSDTNKIVKVYARQENSASLGLGQSYNFSSGNPQHQLNLDFNNSYNDTIGYYQNFARLNGTSNYFNTPNNQSGAWDFLPDYNSSTTTSTFNIQNGNLLYSYSGTTNQKIKPGAIIDIGLNKVSMDIGPNASRSFQLKVIFSTFRVVLSYFNSIDSLSVSNDSTEISLTQFNHNEFRMPLSELVTMVNATYPTKFEGIILTVGSDSIEDYFNFSAEFKHITFLNPVSNFKYSFQQTETVYDGNRLTLNPKLTDEFHLILPYDITTTVIWSHSYSYNQSLNIQPYPRNGSLLANITIKQLDGYSDYTYYYHLGPIYSDFLVGENSTVHHNQTSFWYTYQTSISFVISGHLQVVSSHIEVQEPRQQAVLQFDYFPERIWDLLILHHLPSDSVASYNSSDLAIVPQSWSRGLITGYVIWKNGTYSSWSMSLRLSPVGLSSPDSYKIHTGQRYIIPVELINLTSGMHFNPTRLVSKINETSWRIDGSLGILLEAGDLAIGSTHIQVNATAAGFNPFEFTLSIKITAVSIKPTIDINRVSANQTELGVYLPIMKNRTAGGSIRVTADDLNQSTPISGYFTSMVLSTGNWTATASYQIQLTIDLAYHPLVFRYNFTIGPVQNSSSSSPPYATLISATTLLVLGGSAVYRLYSSKFKDDVIQF